MLEIKSIPKSNEPLIEKCVEIAKSEYFDNIVLLGDLYPPCDKLTEIYGIFEEEDLITFITVFKGFNLLSVVLPNASSNIESFILSNLNKIIPREFSLVSFNLNEEKIQKYFHIIETSFEYCMITDKSRFQPKEFDYLFLRATTKNIDRIDSFYSSLQTYPWNPIQLDSKFYFFLEEDEKIIACGGTHFETPDLAHLGNIIVLPEFRGQSLGIALVSTISNAILKEKDFVSLFVTRDNTPAINLYNKLGFSHHKPVSIFFCKSI